jgi:3-methyladenine DNA glycosylase/8-oxoguanine DNA glycosylase
MAAMDEDFYRSVVRTGYRAPYFKKLAESVADGSVDLERLGSTSRSDISDEEVLKELLALPGVGPYAAAHIMMMIGRYSLLILDSWTRPKYARLTNRKTVKDSTIQRRFRRYDPYGGLAFWLFLTRDWVPD